MNYVIHTFKRVHMDVGEGVPMAMLVQIAKNNVRQWKGNHRLQRGMTCDLCKCQLSAVVMVLGLSWQSGWLYACNACKARLARSHSFHVRELDAA